MKVIACYELKTGKELCLGVWDTIKEAARDLGISKDAVKKRLAWAKTHIPLGQRRGGAIPTYYLMRVEIDEDANA